MPARQLGSVALCHRHPLVERTARVAPSGIIGLSPRQSATDTVVSGDSALRHAALAHVEAALFIAKEPLGIRRVAQIAGLADGTRARTLIGQLNRIYDAEGTAFRVEEVAGGYQLLTRPRFANWIRRLGQTPQEARLSAPAMETLAVVAYRQPVLRAQVEGIRGVQCGEILRQLMERDLVRIVGRSEDLGRPFLYGTTKRFLQVFGLKRLEELPRAEALRRSGDSSSQIDDTTSYQTAETVPQPDRRYTVSDPDEESEVKTRIHLETVTQVPSEDDELLLAGQLLNAAKRKDDDEDDDDLDDEDGDDSDDEDEDDEEDLEEDEWEEVDDEELDEEDEDEEDWDEDEEDDEDWDEEDDDEDWDDDEEDEDEDWDEEDDKG